MADYFTVSSVPATSAALASAIIRGEFNSIATGFTKVAAYTGNGGKIVAINAAGTAQEAITTTGTGSGVRATSPTLVTPILGTPTSGTLTNCTGYPISALSGSTTGTGNLVFATTPTLTTPVLGIATATSINKVVITAPATSATLTIADGKTLAASNTLTLAGTDGSTLNVGAGGTLGTAAFKNTGTSGNTVPLLDGNNTHSGTLTMSGASIIDANATIAAHATTMDPWSLGNYVTATGAAVTFTNMAAAPQAGAEVEIYMNAAHIFTDGAVFEVDGDANWTAEIGDRVLLRAKSTTVVTVHPRKKTGGPVAAVPYIYIRDEKAANTNGGAFTTGAWRTRDMNTEVSDSAGLASVATNQITLAAGTYRFAARAPAYETGRHKARLQNITDATTIAVGTSEGTSGALLSTKSFVSGRFTISASKVLELQHYGAATNASGFGLESNFGVVEVYAEIEFWKEA